MGVRAGSAGRGYALSILWVSRPPFSFAIDPIGSGKSSIHQHSAVHLEAFAHDVTRFI
jgi:hypothetical protein